MDNLRHDPKWKVIEGGLDSSMTGLGRATSPAIGVGAYTCSTCEKPHIIVAAMIHDLEVDIFLTPDAARQAAAALIEHANRVDAGGLQ